MSQESLIKIPETNLNPQNTDQTAVIRLAQQVLEALHIHYDNGDKDPDWDKLIESPESSDSNVNS